MSSRITLFLQLIGPPFLVLLFTRDWVNDSRDWVNDIRKRYNLDAGRFAASACRAKISPQILDQSALPYVARAQVDAELGALLKFPSEQIAIVLGPLGAGKTAAVAHALEQTDGVLTLRVAGEYTCASSIYAAIVNKVVSAPPALTDRLDEDEMVCYLDAAATRYRRLHPHATDLKPTIVLEVAAEAQPATVDLVVQAVRKLVCDRAVCHGFVVLDDLHAVCADGTRWGRHRSVWVEDFTSAEADALLDQLGALAEASECALRAEVYATASTRASDLLRLADDLQWSAGKPARGVVRAFIDRQQRSGAARVRRLAMVAVEAAEVSKGKRGLHFIRLSKAMLKNGGSLPVEDAMYMCSEGCIADVLRLHEHHAISINTHTCTFTFHSPAYRAAAERVLGKYDGHDDGHDGEFGPMPS